MLVVETMDKLLKEARKVVKSQSVKLYHMPLGKTGLPEDANKRQQLTTESDFELAERNGGGTVWICEGGSPESSPQRKKPRSPFVVQNYAGINFNDLPELYEDEAFRKMKELLTCRFQDEHLQFILAIPGSGKSRTVQAATSALKIEHCRTKFLEAGSLNLIQKAIASNKGKLHFYEEWKQLLADVIKDILLELLPKTEGGVVLHVDEAQTLMGRKVVARKEWTQGGDPFDLVMPSMCSTLLAMMHDDSNLRCVITGTNFFAPLELNTGSEAKLDFVPLSGTFPSRWVMESLVNKYFLIPDELTEAMEEHVLFLSGNRRAIQHFMCELKVLLDCKSEKDGLSRDELDNARETAFENWCNPIKRALGGARKKAVQAMATIAFPEAFGGSLTDKQKLVFPVKCFPDEVKEYCLAGGLNLSLSEENITVHIPRGCVWELLCFLTSDTLEIQNCEEVLAFVRVARSVETESGHLFERLMACELSMLSKGKSRLYSRLDELWEGEGKLMADPLVFGQPFHYESRIRDLKWEPHHVYCVKEKASDTGQRVVDVGFPMLLNTGPKIKRMKFMCELKKGYNMPKLWGLCWKYFQDMLSYAANNDDVIVCFIASEQFMNEIPQRAKVKEGNISAYDARTKCMELIMQEPRFIIFDNAKMFSMFPLGSILCGESDPQVDTLRDGVAGMYLGTPDAK